MSSQQLYATEGVALTTLVGFFVVWLFARLISRVRPSLALGRPLYAALLFRILAAAALGLTSVAASLRGGDEAGFIADAHYVAGLSWYSGTWLKLLTGYAQLYPPGGRIDISGTLQVFPMALQVKLFDASVLAMRVTMATVSVVGVALIALAVNELAGRRAAVITAWLLAIEPANVFFSTALHKEPLLYLAEGMVAAGGALTWRRPRLWPIVLLVSGCLVATATRPYAGWFLGAGAAALLLHVSLRGAGSRKLASISLATIVVIAVAIAAPTIVRSTSHQELTSQLQVSQNANTSDNSNLKLAPVNFSTRGEIIRNVPGRMFDVMFRPFPWQLGSRSQQFGLIETLCVLAAVVLLARLVGRIGRPMGLAGPLVYPAFALLVAYSLASGNAGTSFRYRTQIVALLIAIVVVLRSQVSDRLRARATFASQQALAPQRG